MQQITIHMKRNVDEQVAEFTFMGQYYYVLPRENHVEVIDRKDNGLHAIIPYSSISYIQYNKIEYEENN